MSTPEVEKYRGIIKGMSQEESELIADMLPVEVCYNRIGRELQKAKTFKTEVLTALGQTEGMA